MTTIRTVLTFAAAVAAALSFDGFSRAAIVDFSHVPGAMCALEDTVGTTLDRTYVKIDGATTLNCPAVSHNSGVNANNADRALVRYFDGSGSHQILFRFCWQDAGGGSPTCGTQVGSGVGTTGNGEKHLDNPSSGSGLTRNLMVEVIHPSGMTGSFLDNYVFDDCTSPTTPFCP